MLDKDSIYLAETLDETSINFISTYFKVIILFELSEYNTELTPF